MKLRIRISLFVSGAVIALYGLRLLQHGIFVYDDGWFRGTGYSPGTIATGIFVALLSLLPSSKMFKLAKRRRDTRSTAGERRRISSERKARN